MNEELINQLLEAKFETFKIEELTKEELLDRNIFEYLLTIKDEFEREKVVVRLEEKARKEGCLVNFKKILKNYYKSIEPQKLKHNEVADELLEKNAIAIYADTLYMYIDGVYTGNEKSIERKILEIVPDSNSYFRSEVYKDLELKAKSFNIDKESGIINFKNGLYNISEKKLYDHTPDFFSINQVNVNFNENTKRIQAVDDFLDRISTNNEKRKKTILEMIGYSMTTSVKLQKSFILYGETARNGKSTLANIITELIGKENISNISLKDMNKNNFATSTIKGKLLNIGTEMTEDNLDDVSIFKMFATGDNLTTEEKFKAKQTISPYAKFIFNANELPIVSDKTNGFYRRLQIIPLETSFTDEDAKAFNIKDLLTLEALEYLAKISLEAYSGMNGQFANYEESEKEVNKYKLSANSVVSFINDENALYELFVKEKEIKKLKGKIDTISAKNVYEAYKDFCVANQYRYIGRNYFYKEIEKNPLIIAIEKEHQKYYVFKEGFNKIKTP